MKTILSIDTSDSNSARVSLVRDGQTYELFEPARAMKSQIILPLLERLLEEHGLRLTDITEIQVAEGPGSFTGLRVGVTIANTFATLLEIPVNGKKSLAIPRYEPLE